MSTQTTYGTRAHRIARHEPDAERIMATYGRIVGRFTDVALANRLSELADHPDHFTRMQRLVIAGEAAKRLVR